jgi:hypothetical protein
MIYSVDDLFLQVEASETGTCPALALPQWLKTLSVAPIFVGGRKRNYGPQADMQAPSAATLFRHSRKE